jgi:hypothetical protein
MNDPRYDIRVVSEHAKTARRDNKKLISRLRKIKPRKLDEVVHQLHEEAFRHINCLHCANCCKTISPIITDKDISRIARYLHMKPSIFVESYLKLDSDQDYVFARTPCPFLGDDNYCKIYEVRPKACVEYPHTNRPRVYQALNLSLKNAEVCPAVQEIFERLKIMNF